MMELELACQSVMLLVHASCCSYFQLFVAATDSAVLKCFFHGKTRATKPGQNATLARDARLRRYCAHVGTIVTAVY